LREGSKKIHPNSKILENSQKLAEFITFLLFLSNGIPNPPIFSWKTT
jgi:hypothetical protein